MKIGATNQTNAARSILMHHIGADGIFFDYNFCIFDVQ